MPTTLPQFTLEDDLWWSAEMVFPTWRGFQSRRGPYGSQDSAAPSSGSVTVVFAPEGRGNQPLDSSEISSILWFLENEPSISKALLQSLLIKYPVLKAKSDYSRAEKAELMPDVASVDDFRNLIGLYSVNIHPLIKDGAPYVGFEFGCNWEEEHGLGVLMHGTRTVEIGHADTAIYLWIAEKDARLNGA
jgi:hypothetical protein